MRTFGPATVLNVTALVQSLLGQPPAQRDAVEVQGQRRRACPSIWTTRPASCTRCPRSPSRATSNSAIRTSPCCPARSALSRRKSRGTSANTALNLGWEGRMYYSLGGDSGLSYPGYTSGLFRFSNDLMRATSATAGAGTLGLEWAAFLLGVPVGRLGRHQRHLLRHHAPPQLLPSGQLPDQQPPDAESRLAHGVRRQHQGALQSRPARLRSGGESSAIATPRAPPMPRARFPSVRRRTSMSSAAPITWASTCRRL